MDTESISKTLEKSHEKLDKIYHRLTHKGLPSRIEIEQARNAFAVARHGAKKVVNIISVQPVAVIEANVQSAGLAPQNEESYQNALKVNLQNAKQADGGW